MWADFLAATRFESLLHELTLSTLDEAREAGMPLAGFAFNCGSAWGYLHISLALMRDRAAMEPPDWEYECAESDLPGAARLWDARYEPVRLRYEAECAAHPDFPQRFLDTLRHLLVRLEREGAFAGYPGIRLLVTEVDADTVAEEAALAEVRRRHGQEHP